MKGHAVVYAIEPGAAAHASAMVSGLTLAGAGLIAAGTVAGAWLAFRRPGHREIWFAAAAGALLIMAGLHLLPDAWSGARAARIWPGLVPIAALGAFTAAGLAAAPAAAAGNTPSMPAARARQRRWRYTASWKALPSRWQGRRSR